MNAINIPWKEAPAWTINPDFTGMVKKALQSKYGTDKNIEALPLMIICRSGKRSLVAAEELARNGFSEVYNVEQGFEGDRDGAKHRNTINGWRFHNLPWEQS